jgi:phosphate transport system protein
MTRESYQRDLDTLRADVVEMGSLVQDQLEDGLRALETGDKTLAHEVIESDRRINDRYLALESNCIDLFALQQPVAGDLRFIAASFKILTDLERVGDLATNFAAYAIAGDPDRSSRVPEIDLPAIGEDASAMLTEALAAYRTEDATRCRAVATSDDDLDALCQRASDRVVRDLIEQEATGSWDIERLLDDVKRLLLAVRDIERVGDHAVNVAARTLYMIENDPELVY